MSRMFGFLGLILVLAAGAYIYTRQMQSENPGGSANPLARVEVTAIKRDLMNIARAERSYSVAHSGYGSLDALRSSGDLYLGTDNRGPYNYSAEVSDSSFRIVATYTGSDPGMPKIISIDQTMTISQE
ncbi:MAG TPA: hypothetical protein VHA33_11700 [Candidatus Angelobacter sp.]|jgi:hypothetical protein|nr:hypothetical protein [Candidatus Angelobacter sp.]